MCFHFKGLCFLFKGFFFSKGGFFFQVFFFQRKVFFKDFLKVFWSRKKFKKSEDFKKKGFLNKGFGVVFFFLHRLFCSIKKRFFFEKRILFKWPFLFMRFFRKGFSIKGKVFFPKWTLLKNRAFFQKFVFSQKRIS